MKIGPIEAEFLLTSTKKILPKHTHTCAGADMARIFYLVNGACACQSVYVSACTCICVCVCVF